MDLPDVITVSSERLPKEPRESFFEFVPAEYTTENTTVDNLWGIFLGFIYSPPTKQGPMEYWGCLPGSALTRLVGNLLTFLSSTAAVEMIFFVAGYIHRPKRSRMCPENLSNSLLAFKYHL